MNPLKIAIAGKRSETINYVNYVKGLNLIPAVTLNTGELADCQALLLPGGGDITPAFFGEKNHGSRNIDTELDILQLQALDMAVRRGLPVLGICKGLQIINVGFGGTILQDLPDASLHRYNGQDQYHSTSISRDSWLFPLYGESCIVNSAHHQAVGKLGTGLRAVQFCPLDNCIEAICHSSLPIFGVQWHPERIDSRKAKISGQPILAFLSSLASASQQACSR